MNPLPPNADELVSAYLDGQAAPDEVVMVESSAELMARVEALRAQSALLNTPVAPPLAQKEAHISAALGAFDALFASPAPVEENAPPTTTHLASVPTTAASAPTETIAPEAPPGVASLDAARERRNPRRFNIGIIAAALAALLLMVGLAVVSRGGADDVASLDSPGVASSADAAASEPAGEDDAMADEEAMEESAVTVTEADARGGLSEAELAATPAPNPTSAPAAPQAALESADEEEAMDDEEAMADDAEESFAQNDSAGDAAPDEPAPPADSPLFFLGEFSDNEEFAAEIERLGATGLLDITSELEPGRTSTCQDQIDELVGDETIEIVGEAIIDNDGPNMLTVEVFVQARDDGTSNVTVVDVSDCSVLSQILDAG